MGFKIGGCYLIGRANGMHCPILRGVRSIFYPGHQTNCSCQGFRTLCAEIGILDVNVV